MTTAGDMRGAIEEAKRQVIDAASPDLEQQAGEIVGATQTVLEIAQSLIAHLGVVSSLIEGQVEMAGGVATDLREASEYIGGLAASSENQGEVAAFAAENTAQTASEVVGATQMCLDDAGAVLVTARLLVEQTEHLVGQGQAVASAADHLKQESVPMTLAALDQWQV